MNGSYRHKSLGIKMQKYSFFFFFPLLLAQRRESVSKQKRFDTKIKLLSVSHLSLKNRDKNDNFLFSSGGKNCVQMCLVKTRQDSQD